MKRSYCVKRNGITLIEVVVSLWLLATLVAGMVVAYSAHHRQALIATRKQAAVAAADQLLTLWYTQGNPQVPRNSFGVVPGKLGLAWRTEIVHQNLIETLPVEVVSLTVFSKSDATAKPLTRVDVLLPVPEIRR